MLVRLAGTRQSKTNAVKFANTDQFGSQAHPERNVCGEESMYMWKLKGWGQIKQGELGEGHAERRGLPEWKPALETRHRKGVETEKVGGNTKV